MIQNWYKICSKFENPEDFSESNQESTQVRKKKKMKQNKPKPKQTSKKPSIT